MTQQVINVGTVANDGTGDTLRASFVKANANFTDLYTISGTFLTSGGALGTPSSGTLTNCSGLPLSGIVASTVTALGVGSLEIGHASDTTISRVSAGKIAVEGVNVVTTSSTDTLTNKTLTSPTLTTPVLGTPSSGTLTSCTGLPIAGLVASTVTAIGVGTVELGHATDTTISRVSAGVIAVEGVNVLLNGGALGTPASGTLTNCSGLPLSGLVASTSTAVGVGTIELGHATDTTISRVSAGKIAVEGVNVVTTSSTDTLTNKTLTSPTLTTPVLGTPSSGTLTSCTGLPLTSGVTGTLPIANGGTGDTGTAWTSWSPTVTSSVSTIATLGTVTGTYKTIGKTMFVEATINITTAGTGAGVLHISNLPGTAVRRATIMGIEDAVSNAIVAGKTTAGTTVLDIAANLGATVIANGARIQISGVIEIS